MWHPWRVSKESGFPLSVSHSVLLVVLAVAVGAVVRFSDLDSNPPPWLSTSAAEYIDEGYKLHSARNLVLFGSAKWSELDMYKGGAGGSSLLLPAAVQIFRLFGISFLPARILAAVMGCLAVLALAFFLGRRFGSTLGLASATLLAVDFVHVMYSRLALLEGPQTLFVAVAAGGLLLLGPAWAQSGLVLLGLGLACLVKRSAVLYFLAMIPGGILCFLDWRNPVYIPGRSRRLAGALAAVMGLAALLGYSLLWLAPPELRMGAWYNRAVAQPMTLIADNLLSPLSRLNPFLVGAGLASSGFLLARPLAAATSPGLVLLGSWGLLGHASLALLLYNPLRYHVFLIPVYLCSTLAVATEAATSDIGAVWARLPRWTHRSLLALFAYAAATALGGLVHLVSREIPIGKYPGLTPLSSLMVGGAAVTIIVAGAMARSRRSARAERRPIPVSAVALCCLALSVVVSLAELGAWWSHRSHTLVEARRLIAGALPAGAIVAGPWAPALCFETGAKTLYLGAGLNLESVANIRPTHYLFVNTEEGEYLRQRFEAGGFEGWKNLRVALEAPIDDRWHIILYELEWEGERNDLELGPGRT